MNQTFTPSRTNIHAFIHGLIAVVATMFLFYIDEGYYDFRWMKSIGNWIMFVIYSGGLFSGQIIIRYLFFRNDYGWPIAIVISALGLLLGLTLVLVFISLPRLLS